jgi:hypothetical protein
MKGDTSCGDASGQVKLLARDRHTLADLIQKETGDSIKDMKSLDRTLMPDGLEAAITKEQMSDLLAFLFGKTRSTSRSSRGVL